MVEVSSMEIKGKMDSSDMERGFDRIQMDFKETDKLSKVLSGDFERIGKLAGTIAKSLIAIAGIGVAGFTALGLKSPYLAGSMAKINVESMKLGHTIGQTLVPLFEAIGSDLIPAIGVAFHNLEPAISSISNMLAKMIKEASKLIEDFIPDPSELEEGDKFFSKNATEFVQTDIAAEDTAQKMKKFDLFRYMLPITYSITQGQGLFQTYGENFKTNVDIGTSGFRTGVNAIIDFIEMISNQNTDKDVTFSAPSGVYKGYGSDT